MSTLVHHVKINDEISSDVLIDGVAFAAKNWNALQPDKIIRIQFPPFCSCKDPSKFLKGFRTFKNIRRMYCMMLFELCSFDMSLCFYLPGNEDNFLEFKRLQDFVCKSFELCVEDMNESQTRQMLLQSTEPVLSDRKTNSKIDRFAVAVSDYKVLGDKLQQAFSNVPLLRSFGLPSILEHCFIGTNFGQSANINFILATVLQKLRVASTIECCLHIAYDCVATNKTILFARRNVINQMKHTPSYEYFPCAVHGAGNYYFTYDNAFGQKIQITLLKLYSEMNKFVKNSIDKPFQESLIGRHILKCLTVATNDRTVTTLKRELKRTEKFGKQIDLIERLANETCHNRTHKGRIEAIVSLYSGSTNDIISAACEVHKFIMSRKLLQQECVLAVDTAVILLRQKNYLLPSVKLLRFHLNNLRAFLMNSNQLPGELQLSSSDIPRKFKILSFGTSKLSLSTNLNFKCKLLLLMRR